MRGVYAWERGPRMTKRTALFILGALLAAVGLVLILCGIWTRDDRLIQMGGVLVAPGALVLWVAIILGIGL